MAARHSFLSRGNFTGNPTEEVRPSTWLRELEKSFLAMGIEEKDYAAKVRLFLEEDSLAKEWYDGLSAAEKAGTWASFTALFNARFPSQKREKKDARTYLDELEAMKVTHEQLLTRHEGAQAPYHKWFAERLLAQAKGAKIDKSREAIASTRKN